MPKRLINNCPFLRRVSSFEHLVSSFETRVSSFESLRLKNQRAAENGQVNELQDSRV